MAKLTFNVTVHEEADGSLWADVKELPGCFASGRDTAELEEALVEAIQLCLPDGIELESPVFGPAVGEDDATGEHHVLVSA